MPRGSEVDLPVPARSGHIRTQISMNVSFSASAVILRMAGEGRECERAPFDALIRRRVRGYGERSM